MSNSSIKLKTLSLLERKEYEAKQLRQKKVFLGLAIVTFVATLAASGAFG